VSNDRAAAPAFSKRELRDDETIADAEGWNEGNCQRVNLKKWRERQQAEVDGRFFPNDI
jgi:hypothetical protein